MDSMEDGGGEIIMVDMGSDMVMLVMTAWVVPSFGRRWTEVDLIVNSSAFSGSTFYTTYHTTDYYAVLNLIQSTSYSLS